MSKKKIFLLHLLYVAVIVAYTFLIGCPLHRITGYNCPFCGMTRAHLSLLRGDFKGAMEMHSLFFLGIPTILCLAHLRILKRRKPLFIAAIIFLVGAFAAFIIRYIIILV